MFNCPNCGAPITSNQCAYCGTLFELKTTRKADFYTQNELYLQIQMDELKSDLVLSQINASMKEQTRNLIDYNDGIISGGTFRRLLGI